MTKEEFVNKFTIKTLSAHETVSNFNCGDDDLNDFIINNASQYSQSLLAVTYVICDNTTDNIVAYYSLANDKIAITDFDSKTEYNRFRRDKFVNEKRLRSYPAIKIARLAIAHPYQNQSLGQFILRFIEEYFLEERKSGCRFVTVDAYRKAIPFYLKNHYQFLNSDDEDLHTRLMYFDLASL